MPGLDLDTWYLRQTDIESVRLRKCEVVSKKNVILAIILLENFKCLISCEMRARPLDHGQWRGYICSVLIRDVAF